MDIRGKGILQHILVDKNGRPFAITSTVANGDERKEVEKLLQMVSLSKNMIILKS